MLFVLIQSLERLLRNLLLFKTLIHHATYHLILQQPLSPLKASILTMKNVCFSSLWILTFKWCRIKTGKQSFTICKYIKSKYILLVLEKSIYITGFSIIEITHPIFQCSSYSSMMEWLQQSTGEDKLMSLTQTSVRPLE